MRPLKVLAGAAALVTGVHQAEAQTLPLMVEAHGAYAIPTGDWNNEDIIDNGFGFGATVKVMASPTVGVYAGWERYVFPVEAEDAPGVEVDATDEGFRAGILLSSPLPARPSLTPFVEIGATYNSLTLGASDDEASAELESETALGAEVGLGVSVALAPRISVVPAIRYREYDTEFEEVEGNVNVGYLVFAVGLSLRL